MTDLLQDAIINEDPDMLSYLLSTNINLNKLLPDGRAPLNAAIAHGNDAIISLIMGADPNVEIQDSFRVDGARLQPIHYAAMHNRLDLIQGFLTRGVNIDHPDEGNCTPLHHAAKRGCTNVVLFLVEAGSKINWQSNSGRTPLWKAAEAGHRDLVQLLYVMGAELNLANKVGETVLFECITHDHLLPIASDLIDCGINVNAKDIEGNTALHKAASHNMSKACQVLIDAGTDVNLSNDYGNKALHNAAMQNNVFCMIPLLNHCQSITSQNNAGHSPMYIAMLHRRAGATWLLHLAGARLTATEHYMFSRYEASKNQKKLVFWQWCLELFSTPILLNVLCQAAIRRTIYASGRRVQDVVRMLPLPEVVKKSLLFQQSNLWDDMPG